MIAHRFQATIPLVVWGFIARVLHEAASNGVKFAAIWAVLLVLEIIFPRERLLLVSRLRALTYWALAIPAWALISTAFRALWSQFGIQPLLSPHLRTGIEALDIIAAVFIGNAISDFFFYWRHRIQHTFLWRFHAVHHSIRELSGVASYHHVSEELVRIAFVVVPSSLLFSAQETVLVGLVGSFIGFYAHANTRATLGPLRYLILDPTVHRIHHSTDPAHFGKNFCAFTPLWDVVFGTAYFPRKDEWPPTGLADFPEPDGVVHWLTAPWLSVPAVEADLAAADEVTGR